ncbi:MAG: methyltransferase domain-containing protein [Rhodanobacteraceae bacterium]|jgi:SAM-dependent methyltransferase|nr:methyltransferase domain-containing protein [Rhodanobacteraceae bacterium]
MDDSWDELMRQAAELASGSQFKRSVVRCCSGLSSAFDEALLDMTIHPGDQMFTHSLREHRDAGAALSQYFNVGLQQYNALSQIVNFLFDGRKGAIHVLDFACGYGRMLRFLTLAMPRGNIVASELQLDALDFVGGTFGVKTVPSSQDPSEFDPGRKFDLIWVASLFSHLPDDLFGAWLKRLASMLSPGGVLCFSVRDAALLPEGRAMSDSGILYEPSSENPDLSPSIYGTTYATEAYVSHCVTSFVGRGATYFRLKKSLANEQDIYVLSNKSSEKLGALRGFRRGVWGWLDRRQLTSSGEIYLEGWAASFDEGSVERVEVRVNGRQYFSFVDIPRSDVAAAFHDVRLQLSGWRFSGRVDKSGPAEIEVVCHDSISSALIYSGFLMPGR